MNTNKFKRLISIAAAAMSLCAVKVTAQNLVWYGDDLVATNTTFSGSTNLNSANYAASLSDGWMSTKGITATDPDAVGITLEAVMSQVQTNNAPQYQTNLIATFALSLDDSMKVYQYPPATNNQFTATFQVPQNTNQAAWIVTVPATNFLGAKWFKCVGLNYQGTNQINLCRLRGGAWIRQ